MARINKKDFIRAAAGSGGVQAVVAKSLKVTRQSINDYINKHPNMRKILEAEKEKLIDLAENKLFVAVNNGERWAVDKVLSTLGKDRGYMKESKLQLEGAVTTNLDLTKIELCKEYIGLGKKEVKDGPTTDSSKSTG